MTQILKCCLVALAVLIGAETCVAEKPKPKKNVLFIVVDDLRPELGCYGSTTVLSPNIDRFAKTAMQFNRAYCQQSVCNPSRTSVMTGLRPDTIGVTGNHIHFRSNKPDVVTLPQHFKNHGYHAAAIGKIYHGVFPDGSSNTKWDTMGDRQSWSEPAIRFGPRYYYTEEGIHAAKETYIRIYKPKSPGPDDWKSKLVFGPATESPDVSDNILYDGKVAEAAIQKLATLSKEDQPFFLAVGFIKPHSPYIAPKKYFDLYSEVGIAQTQSLPEGSPSFAGHRSGELRRYTDQPNSGQIPGENQRRVRQAYYACTSYIDAQIGRVLDELDRLGIADNTIVSLYGDHGYHLGEQGLWGKTTNFELDTRVPLLVRDPGMKTGGKTSNSLVELVDLYPTLSELAGLPVGQHLEGRSFVSILADPRAYTKQIAISQYPRGRELMGYSLRGSQHRLTQWVNRKTSMIQVTELYDYSEGLLETKNLVDDLKYADVVSELRNKFEQYVTLASQNEPSGNSKSSQLASTQEQEGLKSGKFSTSFEQQSAGEFKTLDSTLGTWVVTDGKAIIDDQHAHSGKQCLQLTGGEKTQVILDLEKHVKTEGQLVFKAERWTKRSPFEFRIEKHSKGKWSEIYHGDNQIRVGRAFLSTIKINLNDPEISRLRFRAVSPSNTGILIDDFRIAPPQPQRVVSVEAIPFTLPALVGSKASALAKLKVTTTGTLNPISVKRLTASLIGNDSDEGIASFQPYFTGEETNFQTNMPIGISRTPRQGNPHPFKINQVLNEGDNYIWLACQLKANANIDGVLSAKFDSITFSDQTSKTIEHAPSNQRMGVAVRKGGDDGVHTYRIPGLVTTNAGTLIGVYDVRRDRGGDLPGNIDVGMSRSTDGGRTWEPMKVVMDMGDDPKWRGDGIGDPAALVDRKTGTIWVSATWSHGNRSWFGSGSGLKPEETGQWIMVKSDDDGKTWSEPINITHQVKKPEWSFLLQGPGKGITLSDGTIVFPAQYQDPPNPNDKSAHRLPHSTFIYSQDHGNTWDIATGAWDDTTEAQVIELHGGELMINCRNNRASKRAIMTTRNMGKTWQEHSTHVKDLIEPGSCMASLINVGRELGWRGLRGTDNDFLLFSNPDSLRGRNHMTIKASRDGGTSWPEEFHLLLDEQGGRGYSCMSMIDSETVGILYEGSQADMTFQRVKLNEILSAPDNQKTKNPATKKPRPPKQTQIYVSKRPAFARPFTSHMVLQADSPIRIWGTANQGSTVMAKLGPDNQLAKANQYGHWQVEFASRPASFQSTTLSVGYQGSTESTELKDILFGEVWICAGQSNMEFALSSAAYGKSALETANDKYLRLHNCQGGARGSSGIYDQQRMAILTPGQFSAGEWKTDSPTNSAPFSAVGYFFAKKLRKELNVPVGMINVSVGGTPIESWVSEERLRSDSGTAKLVNGNWMENPSLDKWCQGRAKNNLKRGLDGEIFMQTDEFGPNHSFKPTFMYQAGIEPFSPLSIRGALWYQGESNGNDPARTQVYDKCFPLLVDELRESFRSTRLPVIFVQLPAMGRENWPVFREYQRRSLPKLKHVGMAITIDTGHPTNVHPTAKKPVGDRLARWALVKTYGKPGTPMGPLFRSSLVDGKVIEIEFEQTGSSLRTSDGSEPNHFEIAGKEGEFHPAEARLVGDRIRLTSNLVPNPVHARYAWAAFPKPFPNLINSGGLPASPFTTQHEFH